MHENRKNRALLRKRTVRLSAVLLLSSLLAVFALAGTASGKCGDVNADGSVDARDYMAVKRFVLGTYSLTEEQRLAADADGDGAVRAKDYLIVKRMALGTYEPEAPAESDGSSEEPVFEPSDGSAFAPSDDVSSEAEAGGSISGPPQEALSQAEEILRLVNAERAKYGLPALTLSEQLTGVANLKAQDMADRHYFDHTSPTYGTPFEMLRTYGISYRSAGENIAAGQRTPQDVMNAWMNSEGHRANILNAGYTKLGVGIATGGDYGIYWVQLFTS